MALTSANADLDATEFIKKLKEGIELTIKIFLQLLKKHNISKIETDGGIWSKCT